MFVMFGDPYWSFDHPDSPKGLHQKDNERQLRSLLGKFPNTTIILYDNNEAHSQSEKQFGKWQKALAKFVSYGAIGIGLSDQAWICSEASGNNEVNCPIETLIRWAQDAIATGAVAIEMEPYWYWWEMPKGKKDSDTNAMRSTDGARPTLKAFAKALGVGGI